MGLGQSYLYIYLDYRERKYGGCRDPETRYDVHASKAVESECKNFEVVTYKIEYKGDGRYFDIYIYENKESVIKSSYIFAYCWPSIESHVAKEVRVYYSILAPNKPLLISFVRGQNDVHNCDIDQLRNAGWDWASSITKYSLGPELSKHLNEAFKKAFWNRTIEFADGDEPSKDIIGSPRRIDDKNYRIIYTPGGSFSVLNNSCLFTFNTEIQPGAKSPEVQFGCDSSTSKYRIDPYYLEPVKKKKYYLGIIVYLAREKEQEDVKLDEKHHENTALFVEFINECETKYLKRKDKNGYWWAEEAITYKDDKTLGSQMDTIAKDANANEVNTVLIDKKASYLGVTFKKEESSPYNKYTHEFTKAHKTTFLFTRKITDITPLKSTSITTQYVEVYYLKAGDDEDTQPFLIVVKTNEGEQLRKGYHFKNKGKFTDWKEFTFQTDGKALTGKELEAKLLEKIEKIKEYGICTNELHLLQELTYKILLAKDEEEIKKAIPPKDPDRPPTLPVPPPEPEGLPIVWIIAGSVGGAVLLIASTVGYAIHWYNTTIRLLT
ncbi:hypothetical protein MACJ_002478 [Theileria orientalis]|uniref:Uncharacterized protein n=1 Tax=Theileria orientalis TaxID=68886 RepID=A0A976QVI8_THEOR|nr:hypothetical protein MACJ_002478 [Theileria orientalis]